MKTSKSKFAAAIVASMLAGVISLSACSSAAPAPAASQESEKAASAASSADPIGDDTADNTVEEDKTYDFAGSGSNVVDLRQPSQRVNPTLVYQNATYIPEMFCTSYDLLGSTGALSQYAENVGLYQYNEKASSGGGVERQITSIPYSFEAKKYEYIGDKNGTSILYVMKARFLDEKNEKIYKNFKFSVTKNNLSAWLLKLEEIKDIKYDDKYEKITSYEKAQLELEYTFEFRGLSLTLKKGGKSVKMYTGYSDPAKDTKPYFASFAYIAPNSPMIDHIAGFYLSRSSKGDSSSFSVTFINDQKEDETSYYAHGELTDSGLFTFTVPYATETKSYQFVYFYLGYGGMILTDGKVNYKYNVNEKTYKANKLKAVLGDDASTDSLSGDEEKELIVAQNTILTELEEAFRSKGIEANIDKSTGRVSLDSNILFASDSADLSGDGKSELDKFLDVYTSVLLNDKNKDLVAKILVEGHTDTNGDHEYNQKLSEQRAKSVADYCIGKVASLKNIIESKGYSFDNPIYNEDGTVNMEASRRVVFRFMLEKKK